jgi:hypothetical protein
VIPRITGLEVSGLQTGGASAYDVGGVSGGQEVKEFQQAWDLSAPVAVPTVVRPGQVVLALSRSTSTHRKPFLL